MTLKVLGLMGALAWAGVVQAKEGRDTTPSAAKGAAVGSELEQQLQPALKEFEDAWNRHDTKAMAAAFGEDAVLINPSGRVARGRAEIERLFAEEHRGVMKGTEFSHRLTDARQLAPGLAFVDEDITITGARGPSGQALPPQKIHGALVVAKEGGRWLVKEGRPYAFAPPAPRGVASGSAPSGDTASMPQEQSGTGSGSSPPSGDRPSRDGK
jgi:uncharacterized protein (TIGR02246 family)